MGFLMGARSKKNNFHSTAKGGGGGTFFVKKMWSFSKKNPQNFMKFLDSKNKYVHLKKKQLTFLLISPFSHRLAKGLKRTCPLRMWVLYWTVPFMATVQLLQQCTFYVPKRILIIDYIHISTYGLLGSKVSKDHKKRYIYFC